MSDRDSDSPSGVESLARLNKAAEGQWPPAAPHWLTAFSLLVI